MSSVFQGVDGRIVEEQIGSVSYLKFSSSKANSLSLELLEQLSLRLSGIAKDSSVKVIVLRSEGHGAFCGGASFEEMNRIKNLEEAKRFFMGFAKVILAMVRCPVPVVIAVQGKSVGGALGIIAASDYAIATNLAEVKLSELSLGIGPYVISAPLIRRIGSAKFSELTFGMEWRGPSWALNAGLFSELVNDGEELDKAVTKRVEVLSGISREALVSAKMMFSDSSKDWESRLETLAESSASLLIAQKH